MARNWLNSLRRASFRGVSFHVANDGGTVGRRVAVHEISGGEAPVTEDLGRLARQTVVEAYVAGDRADRAGLGLESACATPGPAILILPIDAPRLMHCLECRRRRDRDQAGYISFDIAFVEAGAGVGGGMSALGSLGQVFDNALSGAAAALAAL